MQFKRSGQLFGQLFTAGTFDQNNRKRSVCLQGCHFLAGAVLSESVGVLGDVAAAVWYAGVGE